MFFTIHIQNKSNLDLLPISLRRRMKDERTERGVRRDFIVYTIFFYSQYMKMEGKSHMIKDSRQRFTVQKSVYTTKQSPKRV